MYPLFQISVDVQEYRRPKLQYYVGCSGWSYTSRQGPPYQWEYVRTVGREIGREERGGRATNTWKNIQQVIPNNVRFRIFWI